MKRNLVQKIVEPHLVEGEWAPGRQAALAVDQVLTHDALGSLVFLQLAAIGLPRIRTELAVAYADHNVFQVDPLMMRDHRFIRAAARKLGAFYSRAGNGICHQVHIERFAVPGKVLLGSDSHTPTAGGIGMLAIGAGGLDVTVALAGGPYRLPVPRVVQVRLAGGLQPWVTAKDVILELLRRLHVKGGKNKVFEFTGDGVATLTVPERATITNMVTELGATTAVFPSDEVTRAYLRQVGREASWTALCADDGADYEATIDVDLSSLEPLVACPSMPDRVVPVREVEGTKVDQVLVGSCTNGSYTDLRQVAELMRGRAVSPGVDMVVNPSSKQSLRVLADEGHVAALLDADVIVSESTCGPCIGHTHIPARGTVSVRTFNRNFRGRSGQPDDQVYLASPLVAAVSAITGRLCDPRAWAADESKKGRPVTAPAVVVPSYRDFGGQDVEAPVGPEEADAIDLPITEDMVALPPLDPLPERLTATVVGRFGDDVTTDDIVPATGEALALMANLPAMARYTFIGLDPEFADRAQAAGPGVIVAGANYGQGSSRENAALTPRQLGVRVVIAKSFARIHRANLINWGILPLVADGEDDPAPSIGEELAFGDLRTWLIDGGPVRRGEISAAHCVENRTTGVVLKVHHDLVKRELLTVLAGGLFPTLHRSA